MVFAKNFEQYLGYAERAELYQYADRHPDPDANTDTDTDTDTDCNSDPDANPDTGSRLRYVYLPQWALCEWYLRESHADAYTNT